MGRKGGKEVGKETNVCVVEYWDYYPEPEDEADADVDLCPPRRDERRPDPVDLRPVKRQDAHSEAGGGPKQLIDDDVVWSSGEGDFGVSLASKGSWKMRRRAGSLGLIQQIHEK